MLMESCALWNRIPGEVRHVHGGQALGTCFYVSSCAVFDMMYQTSESSAMLYLAFADFLQALAL